MTWSNSYPAVARLTALTRVDSKENGPGVGAPGAA